MVSTQKKGLLYSLYFASMLLLFVLLCRFLLHIKVNASYIEFAVSKEKGIISLTDETMVEVEQAHSKLSTCLMESSTEKEKIIPLYEEISSTQTCSIANANFNLLEESFFSYEQQITQIQEPILLYEEAYVSCLDYISKIPNYSCKKEEKYNELVGKYGKDYEAIIQKKQTYLQDLAELRALYIDAKRIADEYYERDYEPMCRIVNAEAGSNNISSEERYCVANVIENRVKSPNYPNTVVGVINDPGQYEPITNGSIHKIPTPQVREDVEYYLRGYAQTGMPDNVVFQSRSSQGEIWKTFPSGHYFCYQ